jgi:hypothetical protein
LDSRNTAQPARGRKAGNPAVARCALLSAALLVAAGPARGDDGPFDVPGHPVTADAAPSAAPPPEPAPLAIRAYRAVSRFHGPRCPHRPSCSAYAAQALRRFGPVLGSFAGVARLLRGARSSAVRPLPVAPDGGLLDPLEASTSFLEAGPR